MDVVFGPSLNSRVIFGDFVVKLGMEHRKGILQATRSASPFFALVSDMIVEDWSFFHRNVRNSWKKSSCPIFFIIMPYQSSTWISKRKHHNHHGGKWPAKYCSGYGPLILNRPSSPQFWELNVHIWYGDVRGHDEKEIVGRVFFFFRDSRGFIEKDVFIFAHN